MGARFHATASLRPRLAGTLLLAACSHGEFGSSRALSERALSAVPPAGSALPRSNALGASDEPGALKGAPDTSASETTDPQKSDLVIVAGGDVSFAREVGQSLLKQPNYEPFREIAALWRDADLRFVNLESQLSFQHGETQSPRHRLIFTGPPEGALALAAANIQVVSTANNHAWDYGRGALLETIERLDAAGVLHAGTGSDVEAAYRPAIVRVKGHSIAIFAVTHVWNQGPFEKHAGRDYVAWAKFEALARALSKARAENDVVLVSYHGGAEYQDAPSEPTRRFVSAVIDAGADAVIGHHPHVLQGVGWRGARPVFFSLGNLVFGRRWEHPWTHYGVLARLEFLANGERRFAVCPYRIDAFTPSALDTESDAAERSRVVQHLITASTAVGGTRFGAPDANGCVRVEPPSVTPPSSDRPRSDRAAHSPARR